MPYIKQNRRDVFDSSIKNLINDIDHKNWQGELNYIVTKLTFELLKDKVNYANLNNAVGVFECIKQEFYRKMVAEYENLKMCENGYVYPEFLDIKK